jgi:hypothetical protein
MIIRRPDLSKINIVERNIVGFVIDHVISRELAIQQMLLLKKSFKELALHVMREVEGTLSV